MIRKQNKRKILEKYPIYSVFSVRCRLTTHVELHQEAAEQREGGENRKMEEQQEEYDSLCKKMDLLNREIDRKSRYIFTLEKIETLDTAAIEICELIQEKVSNLDIYGGTKIDIDVINALSNAISAIGNYRSQLFSLEKPARENH